MKSADAFYSTGKLIAKGDDAMKTKSWYEKINLNKIIKIKKLPQKEQLASYHKTLTVADALLLLFLQPIFY